MKRTFISIIICILSMAVFSSCEDFLDKSPDMGLSEADVYKNYESYRGFMDNAYNYLDNFLKYNGTNNGRTHQDALTDLFVVLYNSYETRMMNAGNWLSTTMLGSSSGNSYEIAYASTNGGTSIYHAYTGLRIVNRTIRDIDKVPDLTQQQKNELMGQAYFLRAWFYFQLIQRYGGMPIFDDLYSGDGSEDLPRVTYLESSDWMLEDVEKAIELLPDAWDSNNVGRPNKIAAMAFKSEATLYACSPLMQNDLESTVEKPYNKERAITAAKAAQDILDYISKHSELGYGLIPKENYKHIFYWTAPPYTQCEYLWYNRDQDTVAASYNKNNNWTRTMRSFWQFGEMANGTGNDAIAYNAVTQNAVDMYEKKGADGYYYPITDPLSGYSDETMWEDRDPRFYNNVLVPGEKFGLNASNKPIYIETYKGGRDWNEIINGTSTKQRTITSYMCKKFMWEEANQYTQQYGLYRSIIVYIRLAEIYLNLAEAEFEATGDPNAKLEGCTLSAVDCLNIIRARAGVADVAPTIVADAEQFREAYRRERTVELMFECKRWWDIRRWMIAEELFKETYPIKGVIATPTDSNYDKIEDKSTLKFTYERRDLTTDVRGFTKRNYWYPFVMADVAALNNLKQNPGW